MKYEPVVYKNREEAVAALHRMIQRKKAWEKKAKEDFVKNRKEAENCYAKL